MATALDKLRCCRCLDKGCETQSSQAENLSTPPERHAFNYHPRPAGPLCQGGWSQQEHLA